MRRFQRSSRYSSTISPTRHKRTIGRSSWSRRSTTTAHPPASTLSSEEMEIRIGKFGNLKNIVNCKYSLKRGIVFLEEFQPEIISAHSTLIGCSIAPNIKEHFGLFKNVHIAVGSVLAGTFAHCFSCSRSVPADAVWHQ
ncbi:uncharacterized protein LOC120683663 [Panicum virgatum]|uniref:uncharacterized protein LOC120683663 n=1 Tax=Panicum virgatum TaxID=38727 RepID=UPI0019D6675A|nr:uncharacterized protein LOC120683663 [Panicum virgatum]